MYANRNAKGGDTVVHVRGDYIKSSIGNVGSGSSAVVGKNNTVTSSKEQRRWVDAQTKNHDGMQLLKIELEDLRREMALRARSSADNDQISAFWKAEEAAEQHDRGRVLDYLKTAGASIFDVAKELAKDLAKEAIKAACGF